MTITKEEILEKLKIAEKYPDDIPQQRYATLCRLALKGLAAEGLVEALKKFAEKFDAERNTSDDPGYQHFLDCNMIVPESHMADWRQAYEALRRFEAETKGEM